MAVDVMKVPAPAVCVSMLTGRAKNRIICGEGGLNRVHVGVYIRIVQAGALHARMGDY